MHATGPSRSPQSWRHARHALLVLTAGLAISVAAVAAWLFIAPRPVESYRIAPLDRFAPGSVTAYRIDGDELRELRSLETYFGSSTHGAVAPRISGDSLIYIVRLPDGDVRVLSGRSTHLGQVIEWRPDFVPEVGNYPRRLLRLGKLPALGDRRHPHLRPRSA